MLSKKSLVVADDVHFLAFDKTDSCLIYLRRFLHPSFFIYFHCFCLLVYVAAGEHSTRSVPAQLCSEYVPSAGRYAAVLANTGVQAHLLIGPSFLLNSFCCYLDVFLPVRFFVFFLLLVRYADVLATIGGQAHLRTARAYYSKALQVSGGRSVRALYGLLAVANHLPDKVRRQQRDCSSGGGVLSLAARCSSWPGEYRVLAS